MKIYICHWTPLTDRKEYLNSKLEKYDVEWVTDYDRNDIEKYEYNKYFKKSNSMLTNAQKSFICVILTNIHVLQKAIELNESVVFMEDDTILLVNDLESEYDKILKEVPEDFDFIFVSNSVHKPSMVTMDRIPGAGPDHDMFSATLPNGVMVTHNISKKITDNIYKVNQSRCTDHYIVSPKGAKKLLAELPINYLRPFDDWMNVPFRTGKFNVYWVENGLSYQGACGGDDIYKKSY